MSMGLSTRTRVFQKTGGKCFYCGCDLDFESYHIDHFIPKCRNGKGGDNLVPSCKDCNLYKGKLSIEEFRNKIQSSIYSSIQGRIINKYFCLNNSKIKFYFEGDDFGGDL